MWHKDEGLPVYTAHTPYYFFFLVGGAAASFLVQAQVMPPPIPYPRAPKPSPKHIHSE